MNRYDILNERPLPDIADNQDDLVTLLVNIKSMDSTRSALLYKMNYTNMELRLAADLERSTDMSVGFQRYYGAGVEPEPVKPLEHIKAEIYTKRNRYELLKDPD